MVSTLEPWLCMDGYRVVSDIKDLRIDMLNARIAYLEKLVDDYGIVVEGNVGEAIARRIEADKFHESDGLNDREINAILACRIRYANIARGRLC